MHSAAATAPRSTHPAGTASRTSACTVALLQSPLYLDHQAMDQLSGRDRCELIDEKLGRGGHGTFSKGEGTWARKLLEGGELPGHVQIYLAIRGAGTDVDAVQKALEGKHPDEVAKIANDFKETFGKGV